VIGQTISHYKVLEKLGEGGMGVVYKAEDLKLLRPVALKFLPPKLTGDPVAKDRFINEARAASALQHDNILAIHDIDETSDGDLFIVMDYYPGESLKEKIARGPIEPTTAVGIAAQIGTGLSKAHENGIVHRDVKPANIIITKEGEVKIVDFGLAKLASLAGLTKTGSTLGTAAYMSPEQAQGLNVDHRTDIWSLGVVLFEMLTGKLPFRGEHEAAMVYSIVNEAPFPIRSLRPDVPSSLEVIVARCLEKDRDKRYQRADEFLERLRRLQEKAGITAKAPASRSRVLWLTVVACVVVGFLLFLFIPAKRVATERMSIAVLPFKNMSDSKQDEYFSDGVTEEIITSLSKIGDLKVISRTSIMRYKNTEMGLRDIAQELGAGVVLEGSVRRSAGRVRITGQLIDAKTDEHIWADSYEREMKDVFAIQTDVAEKIAIALRGKLSPEEKTRLVARPTESLTAYDLYLRGRFQWRRRTQESLQNAADYFERAVQQDPTYALAYVGLADCFALYPYYGITSISRADANGRAERYARKALEVNPNLAEAHTSLGNVFKEWTWDWGGAEREFKKAIELDPNYATAHQWYSECLGTMGRFEESLAEARRAVELEPFNAVMGGQVAVALLRLRRYDETSNALNKAIELDPVFPGLHRTYHRVYRLQGLWGESVEELRRTGAPEEICEIYSLVTSSPQRAAKLLQTYRFPGDWKYFLVEIYVELGLKEKALDELELLIREKAVELPYIIHVPTLDLLVQEPRYQKLLKTMGLNK